VLFHPSFTEGEVLDMLEDEAVYVGDIAGRTKVIRMVEVERAFFLGAGVFWGVRNVLARTWG